MRRSTMVKLTLLPLLASAAIASLASADPNGPPGTTDPVLSPPGMTQPVPPNLDCNNPDPALRPANCGSSHFSGTFRGGFGHYFGTSSGGAGG